MRSLLLSATVAAAVFAAAADSPKVWDFEKSEAGKLPEGWTTAKTGEGSGSVWKVLEDESAPAGAKVLAQTSSEGPRSIFNLCVADAPDYMDLDLSVSLKAVEGKIDQGGGPVWRYQDADNYYIARLNPLEANYRVYKVVEGKRTQLGTVDVEKPESQAGKWYTIRIVEEGDKIACYLDGKLRMEVTDATFAKAGKIGLWTKADAVTSFDRLTVSGKPRRGGPLSQHLHSM